MLSQDAIILLLQKCALETMLSNPTFQKPGTPQNLVKSILTIITTDHPKTYLLWGSSIKQKLFLYAAYRQAMSTPELNQFVASTSLSEKKQYALKAAKELEQSISANTSTTELNQVLDKIMNSLSGYHTPPPSHY